MHLLFFVIFLKKVKYGQQTQIMPFSGHGLPPSGHKLTTSTQVSSGATTPVITQYPNCIFRAALDK